ncbi:GAF and ANTAR domain-containing protein [Egicoccus halophilus]|uniref:ANTAR domain-containing protein n=1 Tax=Egicoccus halophilus TaxID=1670830 RepID=A0A8J3EUA5_9ACTN|nr:GAF and ANTAR domain-containing protein [Egicoccus halophilus]GGI06759.1 hypothetical protein GCM10011354_20700 [Egicoccus halophilus]
MQQGDRPEPRRVERLDLAAMPADGAYAAALQHLGHLLIDGTELREVLLEVVAGIRLAVPHVDAVSVTTLDEDGAYTTAVSTDPRAQRVDELEHREHLGPCVVAFETGERQLVTDVREDERWPAFNAAAETAGFRCVAGLPLHAGGAVQGALNLFAAQPHGLDEDDLDRCRRLVPAVGAALANARALLGSERLAQQHERRLQEIAVLHQAVGVLMADRGCDARTAASLLERTAEATSRTLHDVAEQIVGSLTDG